MTSIQYQRYVASAEGKKALLQKQADEKASAVEQQKADLIILEKAQTFIQTVAKATQSRLQFHIIDTVQILLDAVFPNQYTFNIEFEVKNGKTVANLIFTKAGCEVDILRSAGGGVVDTASLALRIAAWSLSRTDNVLVLDEPVAKVQPQALQEVLWQVMNELSQKLHLQFIIVTNQVNNGNVQADKEFRITMEIGEEIHDEKWDVSHAEVL